MKTVRILLSIIVASLSFFSAATVIAVEDWTDIRSKIEEKYDGFSGYIKDMSFSTSSSMEGFGFSGNMWMKGDLYKMEMDMPMGAAENMPAEMASMKNTMIYDGEQFWMISPFGKMKMGKEMLKDADMPDISQKHWFEWITDETVYLGKEDVDGTDCYALDFTDQGGTQFIKCWIDVKDLKIVQSLPRHQKNIVTKLSDYHMIAGKWPTPLVAKGYRDGELFFTTTTKNLQINTGLPDSLFDPDAVQSSGPDYTSMIQGMISEQMKQEEERGSENYDEQER
ncbi:outer membrane lipoprotein carrier protein LolA [Candidatus Omnitrophota bacterium]